MAEDRGGEIGKIMPYWPLIALVLTFVFGGAKMVENQQAQARELGRSEMRLDEHDSALLEVRTRLTRIETITAESRAFSAETNGLVKQMKQSMDRRPVR